MTKVTIKIVSARGHDQETLPVVEALARIQDQVKNGGKWLYKDGDHVADVDNLSIDDLIQAETLTMANQIIGG